MANTLLLVGGLAVGAYAIYYFVTNGYLEKILGELPKPSGGSTTGDSDIGKDEEDEDEEGDEDEGGDDADFARAYSIRRAYRGYRPYGERITLG